MTKTWHILLILAPLLAVARDPGPDSARLTPTVRAVHRVLPTVVNISTERMVTRHYDPFATLYQRYFGIQEHSYKVPRPSLGSGVIVDPAGLVLTNDHVVKKASRIIVDLADDREFEAEVIATDVKNDLALLRLTGIEGELELEAIDFAVPDDLLLGEQVVTVGNPFGFGHSVAAGVLSATSRKAVLEGEVVFDDILQTDAPINPGNSGGPLVNADGQLIGINLAIRPDAQGIGFAIPLKRIERMLGIWLIPARFGLNSCGIVPATELNADGEPHVVLADVFRDSPADKAGLKTGDVITRFNGRAVSQAVDVSRRLWRLVAGDEVKVTLGDGREVAFNVAEMARLDGKELASRKLGVELQELTSDLAGALRLPYHRGLVVSEVQRGSVLARRGIQRGDVIIQIGETPVWDFTMLYRALSQLHPGDVVALVVDRVTVRGGIVQINRYAVELPF